MGTKATTKPDLINNPPHYTDSEIQPLDFIVSHKFSFLEGNVIKYVSRYKLKGTPTQDLQKAQFYLNRLILEVSKENA